jgi:hypothetical protein
MMVWVVAVVLLSGCGQLHSHSNALPTSTPGPPFVPISARIRHPDLPPPTPPPDPGTLPQTDALPQTDDPVFQDGVQALWRGIVTGDAAPAQSFFFPETAYVQVKDIWNPQDDYQNRLIALYDLDIQAAHDHLGADAASARLVGVDVPTSQAEWIVPGVEYNKGSYYRVYGTRLTYQVDGQTHSFGIFSLISWRGEWYVVHLGPSTRSGYEGIVVDPA